MGRSFIFRVMLLAICLLHFSLFDCVFAQDMDFVKKTIARLSSKEFAGRGYSSGGDSLAAYHIAGILKKNKLKQFPGGYFQTFKMPVNTFPGSMKLQINDSVLIPGYDYLVSAGSPSVSGRFPLIVMDRNMIDFPENFREITKDSIQKSFILIDTLQMKNKGFKDAVPDILNYNLFGAKGIIEVGKKNLMHRVSQNVMPFPKIILQRGALLDSMHSVSVSIENEYHKAYTTRNVIAFLPGKVDSFIVFTAHYDHLGEMGEGIYFPGANDNASGTAMVLELARHFAKNKKKLKYSMAFIFFSAEEMGLVGSFHYVSKPVFPLSRIKFLINLDMVGSGENGIKVVNGTEHKNEFDKLVMLNNVKKYLSETGIRGPAANSDHYPFHQKGVPSFFIYTLGEYSEYHSLFDNAESLPLSKFRELFKLLVDFTNSF